MVVPLKPSDRKLVHQIMDSALVKVRGFAKDTLHLTDDMLRHKLDHSICQAASDGEEADIWYEQDPSYGVCKNYVVRIDQAFISDRKFYALLRHAIHPEVDGQLACITAVDEAEVKISIRDGRWLEEEPKEPRKGSLAAKMADSMRRGIMIEAVDETGTIEPIQDLLLVYPDRGTGYLYKHVNNKEELRQAVFKALAVGVLPEEIRLYRVFDDFEINIEINL